MNNIPNNTNNQSSTTGQYSNMKAFKVTAMVLIDICALVGNTLVCCSVYKNRRLRTKTNVLILTLALSDLVSALFVFPLVIAFFCLV